VPGCIACAHVGEADGEVEEDAVAVTAVVVVEMLTDGVMVMVVTALGV
jgi:hypothetical protein